uniref:Sulfotransferase 1C2like [Musca domestica] n=1 Tax=Lepeophtheirus salmonis TaxID=72036 RepID=A0A0K2TDB9_LEPSM
MKEDISLVIDKIVDFLELPRLDTDHKQKLMEYISINQMRNNSAVNRKVRKEFLIRLFL